MEIAEKILQGDIASASRLITMIENSSEEEVFIRSMATRGNLGGLARATRDAVSVMDALGKDVIIVETVEKGVVKMKKGAIVYIAGGERMEDDFDVEQAVKRLNIKADRVEVVSPEAGHFDVMDAWWMLLAKGMGLIICLIAEVLNCLELKLTGRELRLCG